MPDPSPALLLTPAGFSVLDQSTVFDWTDASIYLRDATNFDADSAPVFDASTFPISGVVYSSSTFNSVPTFGLYGDYAIYCVGCLGPGGFGIHPQAAIASAGVGGSQGPLWMTDTVMGGGTVGGAFSVPASVGISTPHLFSIRRVGNRVTLKLDGNVVGTVTVGSVQGFNVTDPASVKSQHAGGGSFVLTHLQVYDQTFSDAGDAALTAQLIATYNL